MAAPDFPSIVKIDLDKPNYAIARFSTVCAVGRSIRANLRNLYDATNRKSTPNWSGIIESVSAFLDNVLPASGASDNPDKQIDLVKKTISGIAQVEWPSANPKLHLVMTQLAEDIKPFKKGELAEHLRSLYEAGISLASKCVTKWGTTRAIHAMKKAIKEKRGNLIFVLQEGPTYTFCENEESEQHHVHLILGNSPQMLNSYLSLEFYFFHEFLSHVFLECDDLSGKLSDGYLFALEKVFFRGNCHLLENGFALHSKVVDEDLVAHRQRIGKGTGPQEDREGLYLWLDSNCGPGKLPRFLLELASQQRGTDLAEKLLAIFEVIANTQNEKLAKIRDNPRYIIDSPTGDANGNLV